MKKVFFLLMGTGLLAACAASAPKPVGINATPEAVTKAIAKADKSCKTDADCVAVKKGCCPCAGYAAVNTKAAEKVNKIWAEECEIAPCTREMCYVEITPKCEQNICIGEPKPMESYFGK
ncbi:hypothetical protein [Candidatus Avelusimicrobium aviculae]|uniref:hypothetical protein n=1 Tax=Candidatus Avelusimicrobium aviculae TaxID=3416206 RepID=UPI003D0B1CDB